MTLRHWLFGALSLFCAAHAPAQGRGFDGVLTISHGYYIDAEGRQISLVGKKVPFHGEPFALGGIGPRPHGTPGTAGVDTVYLNDHGPLSYVVSPIPMPSALDDVLMVNAAGATWQTLMMGVNCNISDPNDDFLIRWIGYRTFTAGLGAGVSAFSNVAMDFGGRMNIFLADPFAEVPGAFKLTFNIGGFNLSSPANQLYFAQQFRMWGGGPNAPFRDEFDSVFSMGFPNPGTSQETFYWDFEPNGIYDETEVDIWPLGSEANMLLGITALQTGTVETRFPSQFSFQPGVLVSGGLGDLWDNDGFEMVAGPGVVLTSGQAPLRMTLTSTSTTTSPTRVAMLIEGRSTSNVIRQQVEFWNYQTNQWVLADTRNTSTTSTVIEVEALGVPSQYVHPTSRQMQTRLSYKAMGPLLTYPWRMRWDQAVWKVTRP